MDYKEIRQVINKYAVKIARLEARQKEMLKRFYVLADQAKVKQIREKIKGKTVL